MTIIGRGKLKNQRALTLLGFRLECSLILFNLALSSSLGCSRLGSWIAGFEVRAVAVASLGITVHFFCRLESPLSR